MNKDIKVICFDADDTLWENEPFYRNTEQQFTQLMTGWADQETSDKELLKTEIANLLFMATVQRVLFCLCWKQH